MPSVGLVDELKEFTRNASRRTQAFDHDLRYGNGAL